MIPLLLGFAASTFASALVFFAIQAPATLNAVEAPPSPAPNPVKAPAARAEIRQIIRSSPTDSAPTVPPGMVLIPGGEVTVGLPAERVFELGQKDIIAMSEFAAETPRHTETVDDFFIDRTEVTNLQWKVFLEATGREPNRDLLEYGWPGGEIPDDQEYFPISNIALTDIRDYLRWCGKRLPTEAEWVRAARGDDERDYPWGDRWNSKYTQSAISIPQEPVQVGSYPEGASPYGVLDMAGNVWEIVDSPFSEFDGFERLEYREGRGRGDRSPLLPRFNSTQKVLKGGSFIGERRYLRIDTRIGVGPVDNDANIGFRAASSAKPGLDTLSNAMSGFSAMLPDVGLDLDDIFCQEITDYDEERQVITGYRYLCFAHKAPERGVFSSMKSDSRDEPIVLGLITTSEDFAEPLLPAGTYVVAFKVKGESRKYRDKRREERRSGSRSDDEPAAVVDPTLGASAPWPGVGSYSFDPGVIVEDIDFPQDRDVILFLNENDAVVGWVPAGDVSEDEFEPISSVDAEGGRQWTLNFSLDLVKSRRMPRFDVSLKIYGDGLR